jgi:hypothetical protein
VSTPILVVDVRALLKQRHGHLCKTRHTSMVQGRVSTPILGVVRALFKQRHGHHCIPIYTSTN